MSTSIAAFKRCSPPILVLLTLALPAPAAHATPLTDGAILSEFNAVVSGQFTSSSDVEGRLVVNDLASAATLYSSPRGTAAASSFAAVNAITIGNAVTSANVNNGGSVNYVASNAGHFNLNGGGQVVQNQPAFAMSDFTTPLHALQAQLAGLTANSGVNASDPNNFTFNSVLDAHGDAVYQITAAQLQGARNLVFGGASESANAIIIDVTGNFDGTSTNFNADTYLNRHILWNFEDATSVEVISASAFGAFPSPAPSSWVEIYGLNFTTATPLTWAAANFNGNGELHDFTFAGTLPPDPNSVPAPPVLGLLAAGLAGVLGRRRARPWA